jgi:hypothetical protein
MTYGSHLGKENFHQALRSIRIEGKSNLARVIIVSDADDDAVAAFFEIQEQLRQMRASASPIDRKYAVPDSAGVLKSGDISVGVLILPVGQPTGCLEDVLYPGAVTALARNVPAIDAMSAATDIVGWGPRSQVKAKLRCLLASAHQSQPSIPLQNLWNDTKGGKDLIPIASPEFDATAEALKLLLV